MARHAGRDQRVKRIIFPEESVNAVAKEAETPGTISTLKGNLALRYSILELTICRLVSPCMEIPGSSYQYPPLFLRITESSIWSVPV